MRITRSPNDLCSEVVWQFLNQPLFGIETKQKSLEEISSDPTAAVEPAVGYVNRAA